MPIELPQSGTVRGSGTCDRMKSSVARPAVLERDGRRFDRGEESARRVHLAHDLVHLRQRLGRLVDDEVGAFGHDGQLVVRDERRDLDDDVVGGVEAGHLEVHPHEHDGRS